MPLATRVQIPTLVRIKPGALERVGKYLDRLQLSRIVVLHSSDLPNEIIVTLKASLAEHAIDICASLALADASFEESKRILTDLPPDIHGMVGLGGGKALDLAKHVAFLARLPYVAVPTSLSNDGFCSPLASLTVDGKRRSFSAAMPIGIVVDTRICLNAPKALWCSGIGDLAAKVTAIHDWKLAFHKHGTPVDDFAALLSDATVFQFMARPKHDLEGVRLLATALMLNGVAMEICGSSRPASGSEHLISHALDQIATRPRLHGLQVGVATYLMSHLQGQGTERLHQLFQATGFWDFVASDPFHFEDWEKALRLAPTLKSDFHTVLSEGDYLEPCLRLLKSDPHLSQCVISTEGDPVHSP